MNKYIICCLTIFLSFTLSYSEDIEVYVSCNRGDDVNNTGTKELPYKTIPRAIRNIIGNVDLKIFVTEGIYEYEIISSTTIYDTLSITGGYDDNWEHTGKPLTILKGSISTKSLKYLELNYITFKDYITSSNDDLGCVIWCEKVKLKINNCVFFNNYVWKDNDKYWDWGYKYYSLIYCRDITLYNCDISYNKVGCLFRNPPNYRYTDLHNPSRRYDTTKLYLNSCNISNNMLVTISDYEYITSYERNYSNLINCNITNNLVTNLLSYWRSEYEDYNSWDYCMNYFELYDCDVSGPLGRYPSVININLYNCNIFYNKGELRSVWLEQYDDSIGYLGTGDNEIKFYNCLFWDNSFTEDLDIKQDPQFVDLGNKDFRLQPNSPCIDAGSNEMVPADLTTDIAGNPRICNGRVDLGAYEYQSGECLSATRECIKGDVNCDRSITPQDALQIFNSYLTGKYADNAWCDVPCATDFNGDGRATPSDALCTFRKYLGLPCN